MKNIHLLATDMPSRLFYNAGSALLFTSYKSRNGVNIYITSDEEIKEGDWVFHIGHKDVFKYIKGENEYWKKIVLTTDPELIESGVQSIDDKFLEWFVKNPTCTYIDVYNDRAVGNNHYSFVIPKEKACTQDVVDFASNLASKEVRLPKVIRDGLLNPEQHVELINDNINQFDEALNEYKNKKNKFKQDLNSAMHEAHSAGRRLTSVLEAAKDFAKLLGNNDETIFALEENAFIEGANWQQQKMYSREDMINFHKWAYQKNRIEESDKTTEDLLNEWTENVKNENLK